MNLDELQTAQSRERQTDSLQQLRESFYEEAGRFISQLREERKRASEQADDPFDAPEVRRLTDDIKTAERTVEAIYERRIGKLVKQASLEAAGMAADASGLTREEQDVFETLVSTIEHNRVRVLDEVVAGDVSSSVPSSPEAVESTEDDTASGATDVAPDVPTGDPSSVDAADLMGGADAGDDSSATEVQPERADASDSGPAIPPDTPLETDDDAADVTAPEEDPDYGADPAPSPESSVESSDGAADESSEDDQPAIERTTVRITRDVGEILGVDQRAYDLKNEDVVTLPTPNAEPLVDRDAAEKLD
ncbi:DNA replication complex subunit Gins51 [Halomarina oriensis]|uniref:Gins51 C-terminal domain-containing protein n=1 Tax=Halomarina oriensis TaxID=671145 RepID=A0A6B0GN15_9EURY|nr:hypothetical protein [Halomarina oriensis]MWG36060.1 hypothetical protein [Halomarina oriensis]